MRILDYTLNGLEKDVALIEPQLSDCRGCRI
jgi:hypothetical protein